MSGGAGGVSVNFSGLTEGSPPPLSCLGFNDPLAPPLHLLHSVPFADLLFWPELSEFFINHGLLLYVVVCTCYAGITAATHLVEPTGRWVGGSCGAGIRWM